MAKKSTPETEAQTGDDKNKTSDKKAKEEKPNKPVGKTKKKGDTGSPASDKTTEPVIQKKQATAKEIDKAQAKRLVRTRRIKKVSRKIVKVVKPTIKTREIGVEVSLPVEVCNDPFCPFHGTLSVRGQIINGVVISSRMDKTAIIQKEIKRFIPKYERYEKRTHRYAVHNPPCLNVQRGDLVKIMECRPLSKSKSFVVIEKL